MTAGGGGRHDRAGFRRPVRLRRRFPVVSPCSCRFLHNSGRRMGRIEFSATTAAPIHPAWPLLAFPRRRPPGACGQASGLLRPVFPKRKFFSPGDPRFWTPGRHPIFPDLAVAPLRFEVHAHRDGRPLAPFPHHRPPFRTQFPVMLLCRCQRPFPSAAPLVREERGMGFAPALQPHKKTVSAFGGLVNPADARSSRRSAHKSWL